MGWPDAAYPREPRQQRLRRRPIGGTKRLGRHGAADCTAPVVPASRSPPLATDAPGPNQGDSEDVLDLTDAAMLAARGVSAADLACP